MDDQIALGIHRGAVPVDQDQMLSAEIADKARGGVLCKVDARCTKNDEDGKKRVEAFLDGRTGWLYVIPEKLFETIGTNPAGN